MILWGIGELEGGVVVLVGPSAVGSGKGGNRTTWEPTCLPATVNLTTIVSSWTRRAAVVVGKWNGCRGFADVMGYFSGDVAAQGVCYIS